MKYIITLLFAVIIVFSSNSFAAEPIEQDVSSLLKGMDTSAIDGTAGSGTTGGGTGSKH